MKRYFSFLVLVFFVGSQCIGPTLSLLSATGDENHQIVFLDLENENEGEEEWEKRFYEKMIAIHFLQNPSNIAPFPSVISLYSPLSTKRYYHPPKDS